jgi:hypothetical protein
MNTRLWALALTIAASLAACKADSTEPPSPVAPKLVIVAQPATTDTVGAKPSQALVLEIRDADGKPRPHTRVEFLALPSTDPGDSTRRLPGSIVSRARSITRSTRTGPTNRVA